MKHNGLIKNKFIIPLVSAILLLSAGCVSVGPDYLAPELKEPDFNVTGYGPTDNATADIQKLADWWNGFDDPIMVELITRAMKNSPDIREAVARVRAARARLGISRSDYFPKIDAAADFSRTKINKDADGPGFSNMYRAGLDASWEIDIFGGTRRAVEAARADAESEIASLRDVWISMAAETALAYIDVRTYQKRLRVANNNLQAQSETLEILLSRYQAGLTDELAVSQARYNLESTRSTIPLLKAGLESSLNALAVLLGRQPGTLHNRFAKTQPIPVPPPGDIAGINADILRLRPDIRSAERRLAAESARIGEATAMLYPRFSLSGFFGTQAVHSDQLFTAGAGAGSIVPGVIWPVFHAGELINRVRAQTAVKDQYLARYEKTVLSAIAEVRDALSGYLQETRRIASLQQAVAAAEKAVVIARDKYKNGLTDFNNVLDAQRSLYSLEESLSVSRGNLSGNLVRVYKSLGGGWSLYSATGTGPPEKKERDRSYTQNR